jgi:hypothetical protein
VFLQARGWGAAVIVLFAFWVWVLIAALLIWEPHEEDFHKAAIQVSWAFAAMFALLALSLFAVVAYRRKRLGSRARLAQADEFLFLPLDVWPYIVLAVAAFFAGAAALGYDLGG